MVEAIGAMARVHKETFFPIFQASLEGIFQQYMAPTATKAQKLAATCIFDDVMEHGGPAAVARYYGGAFGFIQQMAGEQDKRIRQVSSTLLISNTKLFILLFDSFCVLTLCIPHACF